MSFCEDTFLSEYFVNGAYCFNAKSILEKVDIDTFKAIVVDRNNDRFLAETFEGYPPHQAAQIEQLRQDIIEKIFGNYALELIFDFMGFEVNQNVRKWHGDTEYSLPKQNASINCFFDSMSAAVGGEFQVQPYRPVPTNDASDIATFYPQKYDIIVINQNRNFMHRAGPASITRRMISFGAAFTEMNEVLPDYPVV